MRRVFMVTGVDSTSVQRLQLFARNRGRERNSDGVLLLAEAIGIRRRRALWSRRAWHAFMTDSIHRPRQETGGN